MMTREELIKSREWWVALIHSQLWTINGCIEEDSDKWEAMAEKVVNDYFMDRIKELSEINK